MKKNLLVKISVLFIGLILIGSSYINYRVLRSFIDQAYLLFEFNSYQVKLPIEIIEDYDDDLPNITVTTLPIKFMKARYYLRDSLSNIGLPLLYQARRDNPFLKTADFELAKYHFINKNLDSAEYYSKMAFKGLPRNYIYSRQYFQILTKQNKEVELDSAFSKVKKNYIIDQWRDYLFSKLEINKTPKEELSKLLKEAKDIIFDEREFSTLNTILNVGLENLDDISKIVIEAEKDYKQDKFIEAANLYEKAARLDYSEYTHYENAALSFYRGDNFDQAEKLFRYVLNTFQVQNGKSEFYLGLLLYEKKKLDDACKFINIALQKGFPNARRVKETFCK